MSLSTEAKVGAVTVIAIMLLAGMILMVSGVTFGDSGYPVTVAFGQVSGLKPGNTVRYAGVDVGKVTRVRVVPDGVEVDAFVGAATKIPQGSKFHIGTDGLLGEKYVEILPPAKHSGYLGPNAKVRGTDPTGLDQMIVTAEKVLQETHKLMQSLNQVFADENVILAIQESAKNIKAITENLETFSANLTRMAAHSEQNVEGTAANLRVMSENLKVTSARIDKMVADVDNNGRTAADLRDAMANVKTASARIEKIAASLEGVATDPQTAKNIRETLKNAREASEKANKVLGNVEKVKAETTVDFLYNRDDNKYRTNARLKLSISPRDFTLVGVHDIGEGDKFNLQLGKEMESWTGRYGIIDSRAGFGLDKKVTDRIKLSVDVYDPNNVRVNLGGQYQLSPDLHLIGQTDSVNKHGERSSYFGVRQSF